MLAIHWQTQSGVLSRRYRSVPTAPAAEEELARLLPGGSYVTIDRLSGLLRHLEPDGLAGLLLAHSRTIDGMSVPCQIFQVEADDVAATQLAIDCRLNIARSRVRPSICSLLRIDQTCLGRSGRFAPVGLRLFQGSRREA
jgi:hypothetical protein